MGERMKRLLLLPLLLISCSPCVHAETLVDIERLAEAIYKAEGAERAVKPYGILSVPCEGKEHCGRICRNTIKNNLRRYAKSKTKESFIQFLGRRYCPVNAENDNGSNRFWVNNVERLYKTL